MHCSLARKRKWLMPLSFLSLRSSVRNAAHRNGDIVHLQKLLYTAVQFLSVCLVFEKYSNQSQTLTYPLQEDTSVNCVWTDVDEKTRPEGTLSLHISSFTYCTKPPKQFRAYHVCVEHTWIFRVRPYQIWPLEYAITWTDVRQLQFANEYRYKVPILLFKSDFSNIAYPLESW